LLAAAAPAFSETPPQAASTWKTFSYPKLGFSVELPREPEVQQATTPTDRGPRPVTTYTIDDGVRGAAIVTVIDFGGSSQDPDTLLETGVKSAVDAIHGRLLSETSIVLDGNPGRDIMVVIPGGGACDRIIWAQGRLYQVLLAGPETTGAASSYRTTSSFKLISP
jgi:hypothetical protein